VIRAEKPASMTSFPDAIEIRAGMGIKGSDTDCPTHATAMRTAARTKRALEHAILQPWVWRVT
jgi:hypothetical protein